jgi:hypothetical protein
MRRIKVYPDEIFTNESLIRVSDGPMEATREILVVETESPPDQGVALADVQGILEEIERRTRVDVVQGILEEIRF